MIATIIIAAAQMPATRTLIDGASFEKSSGTILTQRFVQDKKICLLSKSIYKSGSVSYSYQTYHMDGTPASSIQEGQWNDRWNVLSSTYYKDHVMQSINGEETKGKMTAKDFRNPTLLWFWKTQPKVGTVETVNILAQNTIATFKIRYTYQGDETLTLAGRTVKTHRVLEEPLSAPKGVYTIWWYDEEGMGVKRYHKTTTSEFPFELISWR